MLLEVAVAVLFVRQISRRPTRTIKYTLKGLITIFFFAPAELPAFPEEKLPLPCLPIILPLRDGLSRVNAMYVSGPLNRYMRASSAAILSL